jgi:hypothetical protein
MSVYVPFWKKFTILRRDCKVLSLWHKIQPIEKLLPLGHSFFNLLIQFIIRTHPSSKTSNIWTYFFFFCFWGKQKLPNCFAFHEKTWKPCQHIQKLLKLISHKLKLFNGPWRWDLKCPYKHSMGTLLTTFQALLVTLILISP